MEVVFLVGLNASKIVFLMILMLVGAGCSQHFRGLSREEKISFDEARKAFYSELKRAAEKADDKEKLIKTLGNPQ